MTRDRVVSLRLSEAEHAALAERAARMGADLSGLVRRAALATLEPAPVVLGAAGGTAYVGPDGVTTWEISQPVATRV